MRHAMWIVLLLACNDPMPAPDAAIASDAFVAPGVDAARDAFVAPGIDAAAPDAFAVDAGASGLGDVLSRATFDAMFPHRGETACNAQAYDYDALIAAAAHFPAFASTGSMDDRRRELAGFLANASHETTGGWPSAPDGPSAWGLCFREEVGCGTGSCTGYCDPTTYPCASGQTYHGRGPLQLSWNYNYAQCGTAIGQDLLDHPDLVTSDGTIGWETALWFWMTPQSPKPSCHDAMIGTWTPSATDLAAGRRPGFGVTIDVINGGLECHMPGDARVADRIAFYMRYTMLLGVSAGSDVDCEAMQPF